MSAATGTIEAIVLVLATTVAVGYLAYSLINGEHVHAIVALVVYLGLWGYGIVRAAYTEAPPGSPH